MSGTRMMKRRAIFTSRYIIYHLWLWLNVLIMNANTANINPNPPQCKDAVYKMNIDSNAKIGSVLYTMNATDADGDVILYTFDNNTDQENFRYFFVEPYTGKIKLIDDLSTSGIISFAFAVVASDQGCPSALTCTTMISLNVTTDKYPYFQPVNYIWNLTETAINTSTQINVYGFDDDRQGNLQYKIIGDYSSPRYFGVKKLNSSIPASSAAVFVQEDIKPDNDLEYQIVIVVYDDARPKLSGTALITAYITRNPSGPDFTFNNYQTYFHELVPIGFNPVNVTAVDVDGDFVTYSFLRTGIDQKPLQYFDIHPLTGKISVMRRLVDDPDKLSEYTLTVIAIDNRYPPNLRQTIVTLNVIRNRIHPVFLNTPYNVPALSENIAVGSVVYTTVSAIDQDARGLMVYIEITNTSAAYFFNINSSTAAITLANSLLAGTSETYQFYVRTYDPEYPEDFVDEIVNLQIKRNEYAPVFDKAAYAVTINETDPVGRNILTVHASDNNTQDIVTYIATGEPDTLNLFTLLNTGSIIITNNLLGLPKDTYTMNVIAKDNGTPQKNTPVTVSISIIRFPGNPVLMNGPCVDTLNENRPLGPINFKMNISDTHNLGLLVFLETGVYPAPTFFDVDNTGIINLTQNLRNSSMKETLLLYTISVYDSLRPNRQLDITCNITVLRNQNPPYWTLLPNNAEIKDNHPIFAFVVGVKAADPDPGDVITYSLVNETQQRDLNSGPSEYFFIDTNTGNITLRKSVKGTNIKSFILKVMACDNGSPQRCITGDVLILVNYTGVYPVLPDSFSQIYDTTPVNGFVLQLTATDSDMSPTSSIQYGFVNPPPAYFNLDPNSGNITLARSVFYDTAGQYNFLVTANDKADPDRVTTAGVTILVARNFAGPVCQRKTNIVNMTEYTSVPSRILTIIAIDADGDTVEYIINKVTPAQNDSDPIFYINSKTGQLWLFKSLEGTSTSLYNLTIVASDNRLSNTNIDLCNILVNVELDQYPHYINPSADRNISEFANQGIISKVEATDGDLKGIISFELVGLYPAQSYFFVNSTTGDISLTRSLTTDPLSQSSYTLRIEAYDSVRPNRRVSQDVLIRVFRNVYGPEFPLLRYNATIAETFPVAGSILQIAATDLDNETLRYNISSSNDNGLDLFFMDGPVLKTKADLRTTKINFYTLTITATDPRGRSTNVLVDITITRLAIDHAPKFDFNPYTANISQYQALNSVILDTNAVDPDIPNLPNRVKYELVSEANSTYFSINRDTGEISVIKSLTLDVYRNAFYTVELYAYDEQNPDLKGKSYAVIFVNHNPNAPLFTWSNYFTSVPEYISLGSSVLSISATDSDNDTIRYYIYLGDADGVTAAEYFTIVPSDGIIRVVKNLALASQDRYLFCITAFDSSVPMKTATASVTISIIRDRFAPACASRLTKSVNEDEIVNNIIPVLTMIASDVDFISQSLVYEPSGSGLARVYFNINSTTGNVYVNIPLTTTTTDRFELEVAVFDPSNPSKKGYCYATLIINRDLNPPVFEYSYVTGSIWEYENIGYEVADLNAVDRDINDKVQYYLNGDNVTNAFFEVDDITGKLTLRQPLHGNLQNTYQFNVIATDGRIRNASASVTVTVLRDKIPYFVNLVTSVNLAESEVIGKNVLNVTAKDDDIRGKIQCISTGRGLAESFFRIDIDTGAITLIRNLSSDISAYYDLEVVCYDSALPSVRSSPAVIRFNILHNQYPPVFQSTPYNFQIDVDRNVNNLGYLIGHVSATDRDGDVPYYTLSSTDNSANYFFLDRNSGNIYLIKSLVNEPSSQFRFNVVATDRFILPLTATKQVTVTLARDQYSPTFGLTSVFNVSIDEHLPVGNTILKLTATDQNLLGNMTYLVTGIDPADTFFTIGTDGSITVHRDLRLDVFPRRDYTLTVVAFDSTFPSNRATATVYITVARNANSPSFSQSSITVSVPETKPTQELVTKITATDTDNDTISYALVRDKLGGDDLSFFYIEPNTGNIYLRRPLTESTTNSYTLVVSATDSGNPSKSSTVDVFISIQQIAKPVFSVSQSTIMLPENTTIGTSIFKFYATKPGATIVYELVGVGIAPYFFAVSSNGTVTMKNSLKFFNDQSYNLVVNAFDPAYPQFKKSAELTTYITRSNHTIEPNSFEDSKHATASSEYN